MRKLYLFMFFIAFNICFAQQITYFDKDWKETSKEKASYYREVSNEGKLMRIKDFFISGKLQMEGLASKIENGDEVFEGEVKWYFENGKVEKSSIFKNGTQIGLQKEFDADGKLVEEDLSNEKGNVYTRKYKYKSETQPFNVFTEWKDDTITETEYDNDIKLIRRVYKGDGNYEYYDEKGALIGKLNDDYVDGKSGIEVIYFYNPMKVRTIIEYEKGKYKVIKNYFPDKKLESEIITAGTSGTLKKFDRQGKLLSSAKVEVDEQKNITPIEGTYISEDFTDETGNKSYISVIAEYKAGEVITRKIFYENGKLKNDESQEKVTHYAPDGSLKYTMIYKNGEPFDGTEIIEDAKLFEFKNGKMISFRIYLNDMKTLALENIFNPKTQMYEQKIFDENSDYKQIKFVTITKEADSYKTQAEIITYQNGQPVAKAVVKNEVLESGKVIFFYPDKKKTIFETKDGSSTQVTSYNENGDMTRNTNYPVKNVDDYEIPKINEGFLLGNDLTLPTVTSKPKVLYNE